MERSYLDIKRTMVREGIGKINRNVESPGWVIICGDGDEAKCKMIVGRDISYFSFPADLLRDLVLATSGSSDGRAEVVTNGYRFTDKSRGRENVSLHLELEIKNGKSIFKATKVKAPRKV